MKTTRFFLTLLVALMFNPNANAQSQKIKQGGTCWVEFFNENIARFNCEHIGFVTVRGIYEKGYRVVAVYEYGGGTKSAILVIEQQ